MEGTCDQDGDSALELWRLSGIALDELRSNKPLKLTGAFGALTLAARR